MSCAFRALPTLIPNILISAPKGSDIAVVSPWIREVELFTPIVGTRGRWNRQEPMLLSEFLSYLIRKRELRLIIVTREEDRDIRYVTRSISLNQTDRLKIIESPFLHAKAIITRSLVLLMSANLIPTSLYRNVEICSLLPNEHISAIRYLEYELHVHV